jgi:NAD(P)-dependent dehydrogenase (short-subunit alcohol dehydrogenase family)
MKNRIVITGAQGSLGESVVKRLSFDNEIIPADIKNVDLRDFGSTKKWARKVGKGVNGLVAIAGGFGMADLAEVNAAHYEKLFDLNARTAVSTLSAFDGFLADGASVVLVGSQAYTGAKGMSVYAASKAAVVSLAKSAAEEWKPRGIRVNVILPDIIDTEANRKAMPKASFDKWQKPEEIAEVIAFLLSGNAVNVSGNAIALGRV